MIHSRSVYSQTRLAVFGYIPESKSKNPRGLNEVSLPLARMSKYRKHSRMSCDCRSNRSLSKTSNNIMSRDVETSIQKKVNFHVMKVNDKCKRTWNNRQPQSEIKQAIHIFGTIYSFITYFISHQLCITLYHVYVCIV